MVLEKVKLNLINISIVGKVHCCCRFTFIMGNNQGKLNEGQRENCTISTLIIMQGQQKSK